MRIVELFSGIGSQAKALNNIKIEHEILATCEWNIHAFSAYAAIHTKWSMPENIKKMNKSQLLGILLKLDLSLDGKGLISPKTLNQYTVDSLRYIYANIVNTKNHINISTLKGTDIEQNIDILTYSFPCQDLSNVGAFHGYNKGIDKDSNSRSSLLWQVDRILNERVTAGLDLPKFMILENVPTLLAKRHKENFQDWQNLLTNHGYYNHIYKLNASDFGLPQNRYRLIMISVLTNDEDINNHLKEYFKNHNLEDANYVKTLKIKQKTLKEMLKIDYSNPTYWQEALECQPNDTVSRRRIWEDNPQITDEAGNLKLTKTPTLTTKQDRHPNSGNLYLDYTDNVRSKFRYLTPRECFVLMGFEENDYNNVLKRNITLNNKHKMFTRDNLIKMAGNSIVVNVLEQVFRQVKEINEDIYDIPNKTGSKMPQKAE